MKTFEDIELKFNTTTDTSFTFTRRLITQIIGQSNMNNNDIESISISLNIFLLFIDMPGFIIGTINDLMGYKVIYNSSWDDVSSSDVSSSDVFHGEYSLELKNGDVCHYYLNRDLSIVRNKILDEVLDKLN